MSSNVYAVVPVKVLRHIYQENNPLSSLRKKTDIIVHLLQRDLVNPSWVQAALATPFVQIPTLSASQVLLRAYQKPRKFGPEVWSSPHFAKIYQCVLIIEQDAEALHTTLPPLSRTELLLVLSTLQEFSSFTREELLLVGKEYIRTALTERDPAALQGRVVIGKKRLAYLQSCGNKDIICRLFHYCRGKHGKYGPFYPLSKVAHYTEHPLESTISNLRKVPDAVVVELLGMVPPQHVSSLRAYILGNIHAYGNCFSRSTDFVHLSLDELAKCEEYTRCRYLSHLGDYELSALFPCRVPYSGRIERVEHLQKLLHTSAFFLPTQRIISAIKNPLTTYLSSTLDEETFMVAFGTVFSHRLYEPEELTQAFFHRADDVFAGFVHPEDVAYTFTDTQVRSLSNLCTLHPSLAPLSLAIEKGQVSLAQHRERDVALLSLFFALSPNVRAEFAVLLQSIFQAAMYMRRWRGPGHAYPLSRKDTVREGPEDSEALIARALSKVQDALHGLTSESRVLCPLLNSCTYERTSQSINPLPSWQPLMTVYEEVCAGTYCVRQASSIFAHSAAFYLDFLYGTRDIQFRPSLLDNIE